MRPNRPELTNDGSPKRRDDATEEDRSLDAIIANHRGDLLEMMGEPLLDELNRIFNLQPGPTLRHDVAHGQLSGGQCHSADVIYACWLLYRVCCLPLLTRWDEFVRPGVSTENLIRVDAVTESPKLAE